MIVLAIAPIGGSDIDRALAAVTGAVLVRTREGPMVEIAEVEAPLLVRALAAAGIRATPGRALPSATSHPSVGRDLNAVPAGLVELDMVRVRRLPLGAATREVLARRACGLLAPSTTAQVLCRALIRGEDHLLAWDRRAWASPRALRDERVRRSLRPVVFDRAALDRATVTGRTYASHGSLGRWLFA